MILFREFGYTRGYTEHLQVSNEKGPSPVEA